MNKQSPEKNEKNLVGSQLGDYEILRRLGRGGMAEVYLAEQTSLGRKVAIKVLRADFSSDENYVRRFQHEARAVASLVHPNIVQIYEVGCINGFHFLAQEYVPGQTLKQLVAKRGPLKLSQAISVLRQVASALVCAGRENMVHRDIKPENILLNPTGAVKVADFGLARVAKHESLDLTQDGMTLGTPLYMSPEQVKGVPLDPRSDLYSCGAMAFYMLVGHPPFEGDTPLNVALQHVQNEPPKLKDFRSDLPTELCHIVEVMLRKDPSERFADAKQLLTELKKLPGQGDSHEFENDGELDPELTESNQLDATLQLQSVMQTQSMMINGNLLKKRRAIVPWLLAAGIVAGMGSAYVAWPGPILETEAAETSIEKKNSAQEQFWEASLANKETAELAWKAVEKYFPDSKLWVRRSKQNLADFYLSQNRIDNAYQSYSELANLEETEVEFRMIGIAGQAIVHGLRGEKKELGSKLMEVWDDKWRLEPKMVEELEKFAEKYEIDEFLQEKE